MADAFTVLEATDREVMDRGGSSLLKTAPGYLRGYERRLCFYGSSPGLRSRSNHDWAGEQFQAPEGLYADLVCVAEDPRLALRPTLQLNAPICTQTKHDPILPRILLTGQVTLT